MGNSSYSVSDRAVRTMSCGYDSLPSEKIFKQRNINNAMNPNGIKIREARDSKEHPNSVPIILGLDVTGSMETVPHFLVKEGLPKMMGKIIQAGIPDPQVLFLGIGDHEEDSSPLQVGQFESGDELLDKWLTDLWLEGGGGGNEGESYLLAWYFAAKHTSIDSFDKRKKKGYVFTIGDEPTLKRVPAKTLKALMGDGQYGDMNAADLLEKASERYHVFHLHITQTFAGERQETIDGWKQLLQDNLIIVKDRNDVAKTIADIVLKTESKNGSKVAKPAVGETKEEDVEGEDEDML